MKAKEIREKSRGEIKKLLEEKRELTRKLRFDIASKQTKNHRKHRKVKKDVARLLTILNEKKVLKSTRNNVKKSNS